MEAVGGAFEGAATGFAAGQMIKRQKVESSQKAQLARQLRDGLITEGVPQGLADAAALQIVREGKDIVAALNDIRKTAADVLAKEGAAAKDRGAGAYSQAQALEESANAISKRGLEGAQAADIPLAAADRATTAGAAATRAGADVTTAETGRIGTTAKIEQETREWARQYDANMSGTIDPPERLKMLQTERASVRAEVQKVQSLQEDKISIEQVRFRDMTEDEIGAEAIKRVDDRIADYEFAARNVGKLGQPKPRLTTDLSTDWMKSPAPKPDTVTADQSGNTSDSQTQAAIVELKKLPMNPGVTPDQVRNAIRFRYPNVDVEEVAKALGF